MHYASKPKNDRASMWLDMSRQEGMEVIGKQMCQHTLVEVFVVLFQYRTGGPGGKPLV
jgi:hypothetical protein